MNRIATLALGCSLSLVLVHPALAHHSAAAFNTQQETKTTGTVTGYRFANPHIYITLQVRKTDGSTSIVEVEAGAASVLNGLGFTRSSIAVGDVVTAPENYARNQLLLYAYGKIAADMGCTWAQLALAWLLTKGAFIVPIPGTRNPSHVVENMGAADIELAPYLAGRLDALINQHTVAGARYNEATQREIDTENFSST